MVLTLMTTGCTTASPRTLARQTFYDASEYAPYEASGKAEVTGQAIAKTRESHEVPGAEDSVYLFPATHYADEWWRRTLLEGWYPSDPDPRSLAFLRVTLTDEQGRFRFRNLPAGEYYVACTVTWTETLAGTTPRWERYSTAPPLQVVNLGKRIRIGPGEIVDVILEPVSRHRVLLDPPSSDSEN